MRLLNTHTLVLEKFNGAEENIPPYAILSHTWDDTETTFEDLCATPTERLHHLPRFQKVKQSCVQARCDGYKYIWIDTCCIDKGSSAELSEAINSMFKWYQQSSICYAYLKDFEIPGGQSLEAQRHAQVTLLIGNKDFCSSRWFDRGWTLQELIAPRHVVFFDKNWIGFGSRDETLFTAICDRTRILPQVFTSRHCMCSSASTSGALSVLRSGKCKGCNARDNLPDILGSLNAAIIMNWATNRSTTRVEDMSYSLIGLFNVNLPLLYGEGDKAFMRLQAAILARNNDHSLLLWREKPERDEATFSRPGCLSRSPKGFEVAAPIVPQREYYDFDNEMVPRLAVGLADNMEPIELSETVLKLTLWLCPCKVGYPFGDRSNVEFDVQKDWALGILNCHSASDYLVRPAILVSHMGADLYRRIACDSIFLVNPRRVNGNPAAITLSVYNRTPNMEDPDSSWTAIHQVAMNECEQKRVKLLVRPSGPSLLRSSPRGIDHTASSIDAVCCVVNQPPRCRYSVTVSVIGGYPRIYSHDSSPSTVPMLRSFVKYSCNRGFGLIGGVHLFELSLSTLTSKVMMYIIWGLYHDEPGRHRHAQQNNVGVPWCRILRASHFAKDAGVPILERGVDDLRYQKQLHAWLVKRSADPFWNVDDTAGVRKQVIPDLSCDRQSGGDRILDLFPDAKMRLGLSARMNIVHGLGVTSNDIELSFLTPDCRGWQKQMFDGSPRDQEPA
ncbi:HET domain-containing protein [Pochonia chlamydosporia 170]|uniref:HET domain-containing protein n=1 Tax=Pochonia chlamydosporia 170 TaxID=1380566 RepID=A0A179G8U7_METCM|nr:HET domain-containing protein [Pochonia chlamydosporia 170]OAQ74236.1 HET domain-containing protein [Pochonia chlamydosporia 170]